MTDYTELIRSLKACEHDECYPERCDWFGKYQVDLRCKNILLANAAAAIEALQAEIRESMQKCAECSMWNEPLQVGKAGNQYTLIEPKNKRYTLRCPKCGTVVGLMEVQDGTE